MTLDEYMKANGFTDESFGERIKKKRLTVFKIRHGLIDPGKQTKNDIFRETKGQVAPNDYYSFSRKQPSQHGQ